MFSHSRIEDVALLYNHIQKWFSLPARKQKAAPNKCPLVPFLVVTPCLFFASYPIDLLVSNCEESARSQPKHRMHCFRILKCIRKRTHIRTLDEELQHPHAHEGNIAEVVIGAKL